jgi:hypothetical protein
VTSGVPVAPLLDDVAELARRVELLSLPHVVALNQWVDTHAAVRALPYFDPLDGGADASILILLEAPARHAMRPRFVSRDNPGPAQRNLQRFLAQAAVARARTVLWNTVPWLADEQAPPARLGVAAVRAGIAMLGDVLDLLPCLRVVVLAGRTARQAHAAIEARRPGLIVLEMPHPSPLSVCTSPTVAPQIVATLARAAQLAR